MSRRFWPIPLLAGAALLLAVPTPTPACPFCNVQGTTLTGEYTQASMILYGTLSNAKQNPNKFGEGTTDLAIEVVVKDHEILNDQKKLTINKYIPPDPDNPAKYLVFFDVFKGAIDPYHGRPVKPDSKIADYIKGAIAVKDKSQTDRLRFFFDYLDSPELEISNDAYMEFGYADYKDFRPLAEKLEPTKIVGWIKDPNTPASRLGLYGSMLGHCGKPDHAAVLKEMLDDPKKRFSSGMDGMLAAYAMLDPKAGWAYLFDTIKDEKKDFLVRYAGLRSLRFFWEFRQDVIDKDKLLQAMMAMIQQSDIADMPMDDLRKWGQFQYTAQLLPLYDAKSHNVPIVRRAVIRYALCCPATDAAAAAFVARVRQEDPDRVAQIEDLLKLENAPPPPPAKANGTNGTTAKPK